MVVAGSLGVRPAPGVEFLDWLPVADVLPLVLVRLRVFAEHGDRTNRSKARLRHIRQRLGDDAFALLLKEAFERARSERSWPRIVLGQPSVSCEARTMLRFLGGDLLAEAAQALAGLAGRPDIRVRIANQHAIAVYGPDDQALAAAIAEFPALAQAARPQPAIVACPGKRWCSRGLTDTVGMARQVLEQLGDRLPVDLEVCISGCPNGWRIAAWPPSA